MKAYIEDARARSRDGAGIARKIFAAASSMGGPEGNAPVYSGGGGGGGAEALEGTAPATDYRTMVDIQQEIGRAAAAAAASREALGPEQITRVVQDMLIHFRKDLVQE
eukprot:6172241-Heterocapsa_arctica.AAC.1